MEWLVVLPAKRLVLPDAGDIPDHNCMDTMLYAMPGDLSCRFVEKVFYGVVLLCIQSLYPL